MSKIFERLVLRQVSEFVTNTTTGVLSETVSAYRKGHNTTTVILAMRDDILHAMERGEVSIAVLADFSIRYWYLSYHPGKTSCIKILQGLSQMGHKLPHWSKVKCTN